MSGDVVKDEAACLRIINSGDADAEDLLLAADPSFKRRFRAVDRALIRLLADVRERFPDAEYYTASGGFHLMLGSSHDERENGQQQLVALSGQASICDGDF